MAKVNNKTKGFNSITRDLVYDNSLSDRARFLYVYMACKPPEWEYYQDKVAEELGYEKRTLRKYLDELIERGWIIEESQENPGKFGALQYTIEIERKGGVNLPIRKKTDMQKMRIAKNVDHRDIDNISSDINISSDKRNIDNKKRLSNDNPKNKRFVKPTIEQIQAYIDEKKLHFEAERFFDWYESKGWMVGKNHMKDWKAACRTWESMRKSEKREEKEESAQVQEMSEVEAIVWKNNQEWMEKKVPRLKDRITYNDFCEMRALAHFKSDVYADILMEIEKEGIIGNIVSEFDIRCQNAYYHRIWDNG